MSTRTEQRPDSRGVWTHTLSADGTPIAWRADGPTPGTEGSRAAVMLCNGIACSDDYWRGLVGPLATERTVIRWDYRGHHRSGAPADPDALGPSALVEDLLAALDAAGPSRVILIGHSYGVQIALRASVALGERLAGFVAVAGAAGHALSAFGGPLPTTVVLPALRTVGELAPRLSDAVWERVWSSPVPYWIARGIGGTSRAAPRYILDDFQRHVGSLDPRQLGAMMQQMGADDATGLLAHLDVPVLAVAGGHDRITPVRRLAEIADAAPGGALVVHRRATHTLPAEHPDWLAAQLRPLFVSADRRAASAS